MIRNDKVAASLFYWDEFDSISWQDMADTWYFEEQS